MARGTARSLLLALLAAFALPAGAVAAEPLVSHVDTPQDVQSGLATQVRSSRIAGVRAASPSAQPLPASWCGSERTSDDTADSTVAPGQAYYKLVYAYAADQPDRFAQWTDVLQADVSLIGQYMALQDGATKSPRFDMGTSCGPGYADIQAVRLPGTRAAYADQFPAIAAAVGTQIGSASGPRDVVVLADGLTNHPANTIYGLGQYWTSTDADVAGAANPHNGGGLYAALFPAQGYDPTPTASSPFYPGFWAEGMLHEMTHTLGAVMPHAPHATSNGHCTDGHDVMCYPDGGSSAAPYGTTACAALSGLPGGISQTYDCGHDDYFNPSPPAGSYLATHWNVYDSAFEAPCSTIGDACAPIAGGAPAPADPAAAPPSAPAATPAATRPRAQPARVYRRARVRLIRHRRTLLALGVTTRTSAAGQVATVATQHVRLARHGTYRLTLCAARACVRKHLHARHGRVRVPAIVAASRRPGPVTLTLSGPGGRAIGMLT